MKSFILCTTVLFSAQNSYCGPRLEKVANFLAPKPMGSVAVEKLTGGLSALTKSEEVKQLAGKVGSEAASKLGLESTKEAMKYAGPIAVAITGLYAANTVYSMACDAKTAICPGDKKASENLDHKERYNLLKAKKELRESLKENAKGIRGSLGIHLACEEAARNLALAGGDEELEKIISSFKKWNTECLS